ncbi:hypothetical protein Ancab_035601 [Ancistrocladus abbreviatus]
MLSLVLIGIRLEQQFGFVRIGIVYLLSGFGGSVVSSLFIQQSISVGASGALFRLLGAMLSELLTNWTIYANKVAALLTLIVIIVVNLGLGLLPCVAVAFLRGGVHIFSGPSFAPVDNYQITVGSAIAAPAFSSTSCCSAFVWHDSSKDCTILKIIRVLPPALF